MSSASPLAVDGFLASLPEPVQKRLGEIKQLHEQYTGLEEECQKEIQAVEAKYLALFRPLWAQRRDIIAGKEGVPGFWLHALQNHEDLAQLITEKDTQVLQHLTDIECTESENGFKLIFHFDQNEFFDHQSLEKEYAMAADTKDILQKAEGTKIQWKPSKDPTVKLMRKKAQGKGRGRGGAPVTKLEPVASFFTFFSPPKVPLGEAAMDDQDLEELQEALQEDYDIGETLRSDLIPNAYLWFTGEATEQEEEESEEDEGDEDDDEEDEDDEDEDEDDDEPELDADGVEDITPGAKKAGKSKSGKAPQDTAEKPQECKQQ